MIVAGMLPNKVLIATFVRAGKSNSIESDNIISPRGMTVPGVPRNVSRLSVGVTMSRLPALPFYRFQYTHFPEFSDGLAVLEAKAMRAALMLTDSVRSV
jgi:hypothetical protein